MSDRVDTEALAANLTEAEKETLWEAIERAFLDTTTFNKASEDNIEHTVEAILAARDARVRADALAPVIALAGEWAEEIAARREDAARIGPDDRQAFVHFTAALAESRDQLCAALRAMSSVGSGVGEGTR